VPGDEMSRTRAIPLEGVSATEGDTTSSPVAEATKRSALQSLSRAHGRSGRGRPAVTEAVIDELGAGGALAYAVTLHHGHCYSIIAAGISDDLDIDLSLRDAEGVEISRDQEPGSWATAEICPSVDARYEIRVRLYRGHGAFALRVYGS